MKYYAVAEINIKNLDWVADYAEKVTKIVEGLGGRYLARTSEVICIEGVDNPAQLSLILEFPCKEVAMEFYNSDEYRPYLKARQAGSEGKFFLIAGKDDTQQANL